MIIDKLYSFSSERWIWRKNIIFFGRIINLKKIQMCIISKLWNLLLIVNYMQSYYLLMTSQVAIHLLVPLVLEKNWIWKWWSRLSLLIRRINFTTKKSCWYSESWKSSNAFYFLKQYHKLIGSFALLESYKENRRSQIAC